MAPVFREVAVMSSVVSEGVGEDLRERGGSLSTPFLRKHERTGQGSRKGETQAALEACAGGGTRLQGCVVYSRRKFLVWVSWPS